MTPPYLRAIYQSHCCATQYKLLKRMILNRRNPITEHTIIKEKAGFRAGKSCKSTAEPDTVYRGWIREEFYQWHCICGPVCCV